MGTVLTLLQEAMAPKQGVKCSRHVTCVASSALLAEVCPDSRCCGSQQQKECWEAPHPHC